LVHVEIEDSIAFSVKKAANLSVLLFVLVISRAFRSKEQLQRISDEYFLEGVIDFID
jgi:hypothetical protein